MDRCTRSFKLIFVATAFAFGLVLPGLSAPGAIAAAGMADLHHSSADIFTCINKHQSPNAPVAKSPISIESEDKENPSPPALPFYVKPNEFHVRHIDPYGDVIMAPSFLPPDIIVLTASFRI